MNGMIQVNKDKKNKFTLFKIEEDKEEEKGFKHCQYNNGRYTPVICHGINPHKVDSASTKVELRPLMEQNIIPKPFFSCVLCGQTGSGKSTALVNMFNNPQQYGNDYFSEVIVIGRTVLTDSLYDHIPYTRLITDEFIEACNILIKEFEKETTPQTNRCVILEDISSETKLMNSSSFKKLFCQARHYRTSIFVITHKFKILNRLCRLQASNLIVFKPVQSELDALFEEYGTGSKKRFMQIAKVAFKPSETDKKPFLHINTRVDSTLRFRRCFNQLIS